MINRRSGRYFGLKRFINVEPSAIAVRPCDADRRGRTAGALRCSYRCPHESSPAFGGANRGSPGQQRAANDRQPASSIS